VTAALVSDFDEFPDFAPRLEIRGPQFDRGRQLRLLVPKGWLHAHPLTQADLAREAAYLAREGFALTWSESQAG
jgi:hypothetical protein